MGELLITGLVCAIANLAYLLCLDEDMILHLPYVWLTNLEIKNKVLLFVRCVLWKVLGGCSYCTCFWLTVVVCLVWRDNSLSIPELAVQGLVSMGMYYLLDEWFVNKDADGNT